MAQLIDISRRIAPDVAVYPGDDPLEASSLCEIGDEAPCNITSLANWTTHFLTHVDAPLHFIEGGASLDELGLHRFVGAAVVVEVLGAAVTASDIPSDVEGKNVLFKTSNSKLDPRSFAEDHVYIRKDAVDELIDRRPNLVGIDYLSIDKYGDEDYPAHRGLLGEGILILEGLDLSDVEPGAYELIAFPLRISGGDGSPVRAALMRR